MFHFSWLRAFVGRLCLSFLLAVLLLPHFRALAAPSIQASLAETLRVGFETRPRSVDPRFVATDANSQYLEPLLHLPLVGFSESGEPQEIVAEKIQFTDPLTVVVKIRDGIRFAQGRSIDVDDVVATYKFVCFGALGLPPSPRRGAFERVKNIEKVSPSEMRLVLSEPDASLISNLTVGILPKEALSRKPDDLVGLGFESGPFLLKKAADDEWIIQRNGKYTGAPFGGMLPRVENVVFKILTDNNTRYAALLKGEIDLLQNSVDSDKVVEFQNRRAGEFEVQLKTSDSTAFLAFNFRHKLFQDVRVRRAIALAMNRAEILKFTLQGLGQEANSMFPPGHAFHFENKNSAEHNLREAELLLDLAGLKDSDGSAGPQPRATFNIKVPLNRERIAVAKAIAGQLKKVGLKVKVEVLEFNTFMKHLNNGNVQAWIAPWTGYKDGDHLHFVFHSKRTPPSGANRGFYSNAMLDELLDKAKSEASLEQRRRLYQEAQAIVSQELPYIFLWHRVGHVVHSRRVSGFRIFADGRYTSLTQVQVR
ncbi:MAG: ABC transporter substrate-binding protein [Betaproteobacteria bacterium]|nr:ABC transporter substrate-binding protein [Betaproteobacteria bacterium]